MDVEYKKLWIRYCILYWHYIR